MIFTKMPNGTIEYAMATNDAKLWLTRVAKLYKDGVINPNSVLSQTNVGEAWAAGTLGSTYRWAAWNNPSGSSQRAFAAAFPQGEMLAIPVPAGDNGKPAEDPGWLAAWCFFGITNVAKDPERIYAMWDDMANPETYITRRFGWDGEVWRRNPDSTVTFLKTSDENTAQNIGYDLFHDLFARKDFCNISNIPSTVDLFARVSRESRPAYDRGVERKNPTEYKAWLEYGSEIQDVRDGFVWGVIEGTRSINEWDKYISDLKAAGLDQVLVELRDLYPKEQKELEGYLASRR
jgi:putative aldouronate transport system substrate-binding protein